MLKSQIQLSQYDQCQTQRPKEFKECRPFQIYQSGFELQRAAAGSQALIGRFETVCIPLIPLVAEFGTDHIEKAVFEPRRAAAGSQALIGRFETACIPLIPLVAEFGTDHIEKAVFVTSASIFSETVGGMKLKFGEEIEKKRIYQDPSPFR